MIATQLGETDRTKEKCECYECRKNECVCMYMCWSPFSVMRLCNGRHSNGLESIWFGTCFDSTRHWILALNAKFQPNKLRCAQYQLRSKTNHKGRWQFTGKFYENFSYETNTEFIDQITQWFCSNFFFFMINYCFIHLLGEKKSWTKRKPYRLSKKKKIRIWMEKYCRTLISVVHQWYMWCSNGWEFGRQT